MAGLHLGDTGHHVDRRVTCTACGTRAFTFAEATDDDGRVVCAYCPHCADRLRGVVLCAACQRPIVQHETTAPVWVHRDGIKRRHDAAPEREWKYGGDKPLQAQQPLAGHRRLAKYGGG